ncbi:MAG: MgtC/SapB family protein [Candidatus Magasanikbacteria bacterium]|nr:MgtC/SapB family protein [Candidatus Magasanikbacteria bacterium]
MFTGLFSKLVLAIILGATIGLEREGSKQGPSALGGIRTYSLIALIGALVGIFFVHNFASLALLIAGGFLVLLISYYISGVSVTKDFGLTTELSVIITFLIGLLLVLDIIPLQIIVAVFVILMLVLSVKSKTSQLIAGISREELQSFISYAVIALVVLPFLPDVAYKLSDLPVLPAILNGIGVEMGQFSALELINPRKVWFIVVLITGIDVFGYILGKIIGNKKGFALTSFIAGFVSSTSATQSLAQKSKHSSFANHLVGAALLANLASFLQIFLLVGPLNPKWLVSIAPSILLMILVAGFIALVLLKKKESDESPSQEVKPTKIFSLMPALKFAGILIAVKIITKVSLLVFGKSGFVISSVIASLAGLDAILVNLADMAGHSITFEFAFITFILVNATNLISKTVYSYLQGTKQFAFKFFISALVIIFSSAIYLFFI